MTSDSEITALFEGLTEADIFDYVDPLAPAPTKIETSVSPALVGAVTSALPSAPAPSPSPMPFVPVPALAPAGGAGEGAGHHAAAPEPLFRPHQVHHGNNIVALFTTAMTLVAGAIRFALLWAEVQCGKTGTYHYIIRRMLDAGTVARVYILCGSAETTLRDQAFEDALKYNREHMEAKNIEIIFRQDFKKSAMNIKDALVIVDESHLDQTQGSELDDFMARHSLEMAGTNETMIANNTFMISVDATPYSEVAALAHKHSLPKHVERVVPPPEYFGVAHYKFTRRVFENYDFRTAAGKAALAAEIASCPNKYVLMRLMSGRKETMEIKESILQAIADANGYDIRHYHEDKTNIAITRSEQVILQAKAHAGTVIPCLEDAPATTTIVLIKGRLRAGKVVPKEHIGFVWEDATSSKTDVIVQGLFGRMCGYKFGATMPKIFITKKAIEETPDAVVSASELVRHVMGPEVLPTNGTNLKKPRQATKGERDGKPVHMLPPILMPASMFGADVEHVKNKDTKSFGVGEVKVAETFLTNIDGLLRQHPNILASQKAEIKQAMRHLTVDRDLKGSELHTGDPLKAKFKAHYRHFNGKSHHGDKKDNYHSKLYKAHAVHCAPTEHISDMPFITFCVTHEDYASIKKDAPPGSAAGNVFVIIYTEASGFPTAAPIDSRIASDNGRSVFSIHDVKKLGPTPAIAAVGLPETAKTSTAQFEFSFREYLRQWSTSTALVYDSAFSKLELDKTAFHYVSKTDNDMRRILKSVLEPEFGIRFHISGVEDSTEGTFTIGKVSWKRV